MLKFLALLLTLALLPAPAHAGETYDRVIKSGTIRCGYLSGEPYFMKDPKTGTMSGIWYEYVEAMGKSLGLKIDWAEEVGLGDIGIALETGRIDSFCVGIWIDPSRAKVMDFVEPTTYQIVEAYVRESETRFKDGNLQKLNDPAITVSCIDGEMSAAIAKDDFPKAKISCLPQLAPFSDLMMNVSQGKADVVFASPAAVAQFNATNSPKLKKIEAPHPVRIFPESIAVARGQEDFRRMLDHTTLFLLNTGKIDAIIARHAKSGADFIKPSKPYNAGR